MSCTSPMSQCPLNSFGKSLGKSCEWCSDFVSVDLFVSSRLAMSNAYDTVMAMPCLVFHHLSHKILIICQSTFSVHPATPKIDSLEGLEPTWLPSSLICMRPAGSKGNGLSESIPSSVMQSFQDKTLTTIGK